MASVQSLSGFKRRGEKRREEKRKEKISQQIEKCKEKQNNKPTLTHAKQNKTKQRQKQTHSLP